MSAYFTAQPENLDLEKEQRIERGQWVFYGVGAMLLVVGGLYLQDRMERRLLFAYAITGLCYGILLYVEEFEHLRSLWLWKGVLVTIPFHVAFLSVIFWSDAKWRWLPLSGFGFTNLLWITFVPEFFVFTLIIDHFKSRAAPEEPRRKLARFLRLTSKPKREKEAILTTLDDDDLDPAKQSRKSLLRGSFVIVSALLLLVYFLKGAVLRGVVLYVTKVSVLTMLTYGYLLYVEEKEEFGEKWLWIAAVVAIPFHIAFLGLIVGIDRILPNPASKPVAYLFVIWLIAWVEKRLMEQIVDDYRPLGPVLET